MTKHQLFTAAACAALCILSARIPAHAAETGTKQGWQTENGKRCYYLESGEKATGEQEIDGVPYLFAPNGVQQRGWQTVGGQRRFYDSDGNAVTGWLKWCGEEYYISPEDGKLTGPMEDGGLTLHFDEYGILQHEWAQRSSGVWCYTGCSGETVIDGIPYSLDENGDLCAGWQTASDGVTRWFDAETHAALTGWLEEDGTRFYCDAERGRLTGSQTIDGAAYLLDASGALLTGLQRTPDGILHYFDPETGAMVSAQDITLGGSTYSIDADGCVRTGLVFSEGRYRYFDGNGVMLRGFITFEEGMRCFGEDGLSVIGLYTSDEGVTFDFGQDSLALTGWQSAAGGTYYFGEDYAALTGWQEIGGKQYYFSEKGRLCTVPTAIDGKIYVFGADGQTVSGWLDTDDGSRYYGGEDGIALTGWQEIDGTGLYFYEDTGKLARSATIDGFTIDADGKARSANAVTVDTNLAATNKTPMGIYSYMIGHYRYARIEATRSLNTLGSAGWDKLVTYLLKNKRGVCYHLAVTMDYYLQRAGYTTRLVHSNHETGDHYWCQVLVNNAWQNYDPTYSNRGNISWDRQIALGNYRILGFLRVQYDARGAYLGWTYGQS